MMHAFDSVYTYPGYACIGDAYQGGACIDDGGRG